MAYEDYWAKQPEATDYLGSNTDIQREKRLNNYLRSYKMPSMLADTVQNAMIHNPYDRSAALRAELAQQTAGSMNIPWRTREAMANELFKATPIDATASDGAAPGSMNIPRTPRSATQSVGPVASRGNINGREIAVPTAGNYVNGAFAGEVSKLGLDSNDPSWESYKQAVFNATPGQVAKSLNADNNRSKEKIAEINSQGRVNAAAMKGSGSGKDKTMQEYKKLLDSDDKERTKKTNELYAAYERYVRNEPGDAMPFDQWATHDPVANVITQKYQALAGTNGRAKRENLDDRENLMRGNMTPGAQAEKLAQLTMDAPRGQNSAATMLPPETKVQIGGAVKEAILAGATTEQLVDAAKKNGAGPAELAFIADEGERIRAAQFGEPTQQPGKGGAAKGGKGPIKAPTKSAAKKGSMSGDGLDAAYRNAVYSAGNAADSIPQGRARGPQGTANPYAPQGTQSPITRQMPTAMQAHELKNAPQSYRLQDGTVINLSTPQSEWVDYRGFPDIAPQESLLDALIRSIMQKDAAPSISPFRRGVPSLTS